MTVGFLQTMIFGTLPIVEALVGKGVGLGTVLSLMMAVTALLLNNLLWFAKCQGLHQGGTHMAGNKTSIYVFGVVAPGISVECCCGEGCCEEPAKTMQQEAEELKGCFRQLY